SRAGAVSAIRAWGLGPAGGAHPSVSLCSLVRPPVGLTWDPLAALPVKQWPPGRRAPRSGRGKMPAVEQGVQAARPQQALGGCGDSTRKIHLGSKCNLWYYRYNAVLLLKVSIPSLLLCSGPVPVLVMSLLFIASVFMLHIWGKYTRS
ncbi:hypothetical protein HPG69_013593, partial [Diceros bicornis minor]